MGGSSAPVAFAKDSSSRGSNQEAVSEPGDVERILSASRGGVLLEGVYPNGTKAYYGLGL